MKLHNSIHPIWIMGNSALAENLNSQFSTELVAHLHEIMGWRLSSQLNDAIWEGLEDHEAHHKD